MCRVLCIVCIVFLFPLLFMYIQVSMVNGQQSTVKRQKARGKRQQATGNRQEYIVRSLRSEFGVSGHFQERNRGTDALFLPLVNAIFRLDCSFCPFSPHKNVSHRCKCLILRPKKYENTLYEFMLHPRPFEDLHSLWFPSLLRPPRNGANHRTLARQLQTTCREPQPTHGNGRGCH